MSHLVLLCSPHLLSSHSCYFCFSLPGRDSDPGPLIRLFSPHPHFGTRLRFYRENDSPLSSLVNSGRIMVTDSIKRSRPLVSLANTKSTQRFDHLTPTLEVFDDLRLRAQSSEPAVYDDNVIKRRATKPRSNRKQRIGYLFRGPWFLISFHTQHTTTT